MRAFLVLWSRTKKGKQQIKGVHTTFRRAKSAAKFAEQYDGGWFAVKEFTSVDLLTPLKQLAKVVRNCEAGDWSPIADELFDAEDAIEEAQ
jgi:hypothetical protein